MNGPQELLRRVLGPAGDDAGCEQTLEVLDEYVEHQLAGRPTATLYPDVAGHLAACPDCGQDRDALMDLVRRHEMGWVRGASEPPLADGVDGSS